MVSGIVPDVLLFLAILWLFDGLAIAPVLLSSAVRRLFRKRPTDHPLPNYLAGVTAFAVSHLLWLVVPVALHGGSLENDVIAWLAGVTLVNAVGWWLATALVLPALGLWSPSEGGEIDGRIALTLGVFGYVIATGLLALVVVVAAIAVGFPG